MNSKLFMRLLAAFLFLFITSELLANDFPSVPAISITLDSGDLDVDESYNFENSANWDGAPPTYRISFTIVSNDGFTSVVIDGTTYPVVDGTLAGLTSHNLESGNLSNPIVVEKGNQEYTFTIDYTQTKRIPEARVNQEIVSFFVTSSNGDNSTADAAIIIKAECPPIAIWIGGTADKETNWHTSSNWHPAIVPQLCTDVYIPGESAIGAETYSFPELIEEDIEGIDNNSCDRIFFMPGGQLGRPDLLTYTEAHVEINYGGGGYISAQQTTGDRFDDYQEFVALGKDEINSKDRVQLAAMYSPDKTILSRGYWHTLSAPLKGIVSGDFAFGGFPMSYIKQFDAVNGSTSYIMGRWADFNSAADADFQAGQGFGHYYFPYLAGTPYGMDDSESDQWEAAKTASNLVSNEPTSKSGNPFGLSQSNGIVHLPYFADEYLSDARREHVYDNENSLFYSFWQGPLTSNTFLQWTGANETVTRSSNAYRFIFEDWDGKYTPAGSFSAGDIILVGNPYMAALDFEEFYKENSNIKQVYHIYQTPNNYLTYGTSGIDGFTPSGSASQYIAPMQSFLVEVATAGTITFSFDAEKMTMANTDAMLKVPQTNAVLNHMLIKASNANGSSTATLRQSETANNVFCNEDFSKIIDSPNNQPIIYTLTETDNANPRALLVNSIQSNQATIPIGITSTYSGKITLEISGMDNYNASIFFIDIAANTEVEITGMTDYSYSYTHKGNIPSLENRFYLRLAPATTGISDTKEPNIQTSAYIQDSDLVVLSSNNNLIYEISVYDTQGRLIASQSEPGVLISKLNHVINHVGICIVKIQTSEGVRSIKVIR